MTHYEITPDMVWYTCHGCERNFTLADMNGKQCPHCSHENFSHYENDD